MAKILIIDDETNLCLALEDLMLDIGNEVETALDGLDGLALLEKGYSPDLILIDLNMPRMTGRDFVIKLRQQMNLKIPVILITGTLPNEKDFPPGGTYQDVICKPFDLDDVLERANRLLRQLAG